MRVEQITFTRFIAAITIVIFHFGMPVFPFNTPLLTNLFKHSNIGVSYFFILSGFVMIIAYYKPSQEKISLKKYFLNRFSRIYPIFILAAFASIFCIYISDRHVGFFDIILNVFILQAWFPSHALTINPPSWSLTVEFFFYAIFPFIYNHFLNKESWKKSIIPILLLWLLTQVVVSYLFFSPYYKGFPSVSHNFIFYFPFFHINQFLVGSLTGLVFVKSHQKNKNYDLWLLIIIVLVSVFLLSDIPLCLNDGIMAIFFVPFIFLLSKSNGLITKLFNKKIFVFLGEISYGIYILQMPFFIIFRYLLKSAGIHNKAVLFYSTFSALILFSGLIYVFYEVPLRNWIRRKLTSSASVKV